MGQHEIIKILEKYGKEKWLTTAEITQYSRIGKHSISASLSTLRKHGEIESQKNKNKENHQVLEYRLTSWDKQK